MQGKAHVDAMAAVYVGIDVCKAQLDIYLHPIGGRFTVANDAGGWRCLRRQLGDLTIAVAVMEATSKYHRAVHRHLDAIGICVAVVNPLRARLFAEASGALPCPGRGAALAIGEGSIQPRHHICDHPPDTGAPLHRRETGSDRDDTSKRTERRFVRAETRRRGGVGLAR
jgi:hypothetical protein